MINATTPLSVGQAFNQGANIQNPGREIRQQASLRADSVLFGATGISREQSFSIVLERSYESLRSVIAGAREELGIPEGQVLDTSAEATANRIADFALNFFENYAENHPELEGQDAKQAFVDFIGAAIETGIQEARDILGSLSALSPEIDSSIDSIGDIVRQRLDAFLVEG